MFSLSLLDFCLCTWVFHCISAHVNPHVCRSRCLSTRAVMWLGERSECRASEPKSHRLG